MQILQIEDSPIICQLYQDFFTTQNHSVESVTDGREGLELVMKNDYDVILLDILMPKYGGMQFLNDLKNQRPSELKKVTIVSQMDFNYDDLEKFKEYGVNSVQKKTLDLVKFENTSILEIQNGLVYR
ncbi:MAG TPA: response regulator [Nitrosopumilaceae archaeon]|nr:response regulator [Nitrosopumilaceae archaeon]